MTNRKQLRVRMEKSSHSSRLRSRCIFIAVSLAFGWLLFVSHFVSVERSPELTDTPQGDLPFPSWQQRETLSSNVLPSDKFVSRDPLSKSDLPTLSETFSDLPTLQINDTVEVDPCIGRYLYVHDLPKVFNERLLQDCKGLTPWTDMCKALANEGFGPVMEDTEGIFIGTGWYATNQFSLEVILHNRLKQYKCRTDDSAKAETVFVPFYGGLDVMPHLWDGANVTQRDEVPKALAAWLQSRPEWSRLDGHDHFMAGGRITWDFRRRTEEESDWGNKLLLLPASINMTTVIIEASPWHPWDTGAPYPTYFHPSTDAEVLEWQSHVRKLERKSLFCFAGAPRPEIDSSIRSHLMAHCGESEFCNLLACEKSTGKCHSAANVMRVFKESVFCLQPPGDSYTRRSTFDSMLAGCIPVFFNEHTAYSQYDWFFPANHAEYSIFIHEDFVRAKNVSVEQVLRSISTEQIKSMRETVISLIPRFIYAHPGHKLSSRDAVDILVDGVMGRVREYKQTLSAKKQEVLTAEEIWRRDQAEKQARREKLEQGLDSQLKESRSQGKFL